MKRAAYITTSWDDGDPLDFRIAEMLLRYNLRGTFYIPRKGPTPTMSEAQIRELAQNFEIGAHTLDHVFLPEHSHLRAREEITASRHWVQDVTDQPCKMFCPPGGKYSRAHLSMIRDAGYSGFRSVEMMSLDTPRRRDGLIEMPTTLQAHPHGAGCYARNILKRRAARNLWSYIVHGRGDWLPAATRLLDHVLKHGGVFHLWGHSWEIERHAQWSRLEQALEVLSAGVSAASVLTNGQLADLQRDTKGLHRKRGGAARRESSASSLRSEPA